MASHLEKHVRDVDEHGPRGRRVRGDRRERDQSGRRENDREQKRALEPPLVGATAVVRTVVGARQRRRAVAAVAAARGGAVGGGRAVAAAAASARVGDEREEARRDAGPRRNHAPRDARAVDCADRRRLRARREQEHRAWRRDDVAHKH